MVWGADFKENPCDVAVQSQYGNRMSFTVLFEYVNDKEKWQINDPVTYFEAISSLADFVELS